jgi:hypothetical protein
MQMDFTVEDVTRIARDAVREHSYTFKVAGVVLGAGGSDYVEIVVNVEGCQADPCQFAVGVFRNTSEADLKNAISEQLRRHVEEHHST